jgi:putative membrane protein
MLITDHASANRKAIEVTRRMNINAPGGPNATQKADYSRMSKMNDDQFDRVFIEHMVADHKKDIAAYTKQSKINDDVGHHAQETLPTLQKHLETALDVQKKLLKK